MINNRLVELRKMNKQTQTEAANLLNVSFSYYVKVENGTVKAGRGFIEAFKKVYPLETTDIFFGGAA